MKAIYLDYQSSTPVAPEVVTKMLPYFTKYYGNPHSTNHIFGQDAKKAIEESRKIVAKSIGASAQEIIFTSGATESNNLAIKGSFLYRYRNEKRNKIIVPKTEHKCVLEASASLEKYGANIVYLDVDDKGVINIEQLKSVLGEDIAIVSIMLANNEIGTFQPLKDIISLCKKYNIWVHTDIAQAMGNLSIDVEDLKIDLLSISGHKIYGPKGIGALYVRRKPRIRLVSQVDGGGQERLMRSGTLATPLIVGFGEALRLINENMQIYFQHNVDMRNYLYERLISSITNIELNGPNLNNRLCNNLNFTVKGVDAGKLVEKIGNKVAFSTGSACSTGGIEPSYVLKSIGLNNKDALSAFRISVGRYTNKNEIDIAVEVISENIKKIR